MVKKSEQRKASVEKLLQAALKLFVSQGYRSTTLEQIASAAGLTKGAVYFYFGNKASTLVELINRVQAHVIDPAIKVIQESGPSAKNQMIAFLHTQAKLGVTHPNDVLLLILMSLEFSNGQGEVVESISRVYAKLYKLVENMIRAGQKSGEFRDDLPIKELVALVMANHDGTFLEWYRRSSELDGRNLVRTLRTVVLNGLARPNGRASKPDTAPKKKRLRRPHARSRKRGGARVGRKTGIDPGSAPPIFEPS